MKVPNKVLNIIMREFLGPNPNITPATQEEKDLVVKWAQDGLAKRQAMAAAPAAKPTEE
jgi:uncharacterized membrane protein